MAEVQRRTGLHAKPPSIKKEALKATQTTTPKEDSTVSPCVRVYLADESYSGLAFHGVPGGHEFRKRIMNIGEKINIKINDSDCGMHRSHCSFFIFLHNFQIIKGNFDF